MGKEIIMESKYADAAVLSILMMLVKPEMYNLEPSELQIYYFK